MSKPLVQERFNPTRLPGLSLWLDAQATTTITLSGTSSIVKSISDRSSLGNTFITTSGSPIVSNTLTNQPSIFFPPRAQMVSTLSANFDNITIPLTVSYPLSNVTLSGIYTATLSLATGQTLQNPVTLTFSVTGGGGGGGGGLGPTAGSYYSGGGGGQGGTVLASVVASLPATLMYTINLGGGGTGGPAGTAGGNGGNSTITIGGTTYTAGGGGGGGGGTYGTSAPGGLGGSGTTVGYAGGGGGDQGAGTFGSNGQGGGGGGRDGGGGGGVGGGNGGSNANGSPATASSGAGGGGGAFGSTRTGGSGGSGFCTITATGVWTGLAPGSRSIFMAYQCPQTSSTMRFAVGNDISERAFGLAQSNGTVYAPYQYGYGDTYWSVTSNTYIVPTVTSAIFDAGATMIRGNHAFNSFLDVRETALLNVISNTPYVLGASLSSSSVFVSASFHVCEIIAYNRALGTTDRQMIEGYLAWKWGMTTQLTNGHPYQKFPPSGEQVVVSTTPSNGFVGLVSWIDMADSTSYTLSGTNLKTLTDKVVGAGTFTISGNSNALAMTSIGDLPAIRFSGNATGALSSSSPAFLTRALTVTPQGCAFAVLTPAASQVAANKLGVLGWGAPGNNSSNPALAFTSQSSVSLQSYNTGGTGTFYGPQLAVTAGSPVILFWAWYGGNMFYLSSNGSPVLSSRQTAGFYTNTSTNNQFYIGNDGGYGASFALGELCIYSSYLQTPFRNMMEGYLAWKWGLQKNLPSGHPYALSATSLQTLTEVGAVAQPCNISGLTLWLDAADTTTNTGTAWLDKSALSNNLSGTITSSRFGSPARPSIYFGPGTSASTIYNSSADTKQFSAFLVASIPILSYILISTGQLTTQTTGVAGQTFAFSAGNGNTLVFSPLVVAGTGTNNNAVGNYSIISGQTFELFALMNASTLSGNMNFVTSLSGVSNTATGITATPWVFGNCSGDTFTKSFHVHEFITYNRPVTTIERQLVEGYLYWKWLI